MPNSTTEKESTSLSENKSDKNFKRSIQILKHANDQCYARSNLMNFTSPIVSNSNQCSDNPKLY